MAPKHYSKIDPKTLLKNWSTNVTEKMTHKRYSNNDPLMLLKKWSINITRKLTQKRYSENDTQNYYSKNDPQTLFKNWSTNVTQKWLATDTQKRSINITQKLIQKHYSKSDRQTLLQKWPTNATQKVIHKRYSILSKKQGTFLSNKHGAQNCSKTLALSELFFDWKIGATSYKKMKTTLWNINS